MMAAEIAKMVENFISLLEEEKGAQSHGAILWNFSNLQQIVTSCNMKFPDLDVWTPCNFSPQANPEFTWKNDRQFP